jgi:hypothetical protein
VFVIAVLVVVTVMVNASPATGSGGTSRPAGPILIVGDSLVLQATAALRAWWNIPGVAIVAAGGSGTAPCDWNTGYTNPTSGQYLKFSQVLEQAHPRAVVFAFTGNPGIEFRSARCVNSDEPYSLSALLANYRSALLDMATDASTHGAAVYLSASPPRNPATRPGAYSGTGRTADYGFNGVPQLNVLYRSLVESAPGRRYDWRYDAAAAQSVSTRDLQWRLSEPCMPWDVLECVGGEVQVRSGGLDAIHLDTRGAGAVFYAMGLVQKPLAQLDVTRDSAGPASAV